MDVGRGLFCVAADLVQAAEGKQFALVEDFGRDGAARGLYVEGHGGGGRGGGLIRESSLDRR